MGHIKAYAIEGRIKEVQSGKRDGILVIKDHQKSGTDRSGWFCIDGLPLSKAQGMNDRMVRAYYAEDGDPTNDGKVLWLNELDEDHAKIEPKEKRSRILSRWNNLLKSMISR